MLTLSHQSHKAERGGGRWGGLGGVDIDRSHRRLPVAELVDVPDVNVVMAPIAAALMDDHREQVVVVFGVVSISLEDRNRKLTTPEEEYSWRVSN